MKSVTIKLTLYIADGVAMGFLKLVKNSLGFDYRSMALYRFLLGIIIISDVLYRLPDLTNFYTDQGLVPRALFLNEMTLPWSFSLHLASGNWLVMLLFFLIQMLLGAMVAMGYKTRWALVGSFILNASLHNRNWLINNGGHDVLRSIMFLSIFLPLNRYFSVDSAMTKDKETPPESAHMSFWVIAFTFQAFAIYFISYILKNHDIWRKDFTAVYYSSRLDIFATSIGVWSRGFPLIQKIGTAYTAFVEWIGPLLLISAWMFGKRWWMVRLVVVFLFWGLHMGIFLTMKIGLFPWICIVMWTIFLPGPLWDRFFDFFRRKDFGQLTIYYDKECRFCEKSVRLLREFHLLPEVSLREGQSSTDIHQLMEKNTSWVITNEKGEKFFRFEAFIEIARHSPLIFWTAPLLNFSPVKKIGGMIYHWVSHHRSLMGKFSQYLKLEEEKKPVLTIKVMSEIFGAVMLATLFMWNLSTIKAFGISAGPLGNISRWLHLYQEWNMFAPYPKMDNTWIEVTGELSDGTMVDVISGSREIFEVREKSFYDSVSNEHWRKFYLNMSNRSDYARYFGGYLCRRWNDRKIKWVPNTTLRKMEIVTYSQMNYLNDAKGPVEKKLTWKHWCFDSDYKQDNPGSTKRP